MKKFLAIVLILGAVFLAGYYMGQQPPEEVKKQLRELSQEVIEQTIGPEEEEMVLQEEFMDETVTDLNETLDHLKQARE